LNLTGTFGQWLQLLPAGLQNVVPEQAFWVAVLGFTINSAAYQAEYFRGAVESVESEQLKASRAIGLSKIEGIYHIVLPQALRYSIPSWTNELVYLIKYSSVASFITVTELFSQASAIASENYRYLALFSVAAVFYLLIILTAVRIMGRVEHYVAIPGL
jgi:polar amino acid transport system permease protein